MIALDVAAPCLGYDEPGRANEHGERREVDLHACWRDSSLNGECKKAPGNHAGGLEATRRELGGKLFGYYPIIRDTRRNSHQTDQRP